VSDPLTTAGSSAAEEKLAAILEAAEAASALRRLCVGAPLETDQLSRCVFEGDSKADFDGIVSIFYIVWNETWKKDVEFFSRSGGSSRIREFAQLIVDLRTAAQHADNQRAQDVYRRWVKANGGAPTSWRACVVVLLEVAALATKALTGAMNYARSDPSVIERWRQSETLSARSSVAAVAQDLGLVLSASQLQRHSRDVDKRLRHNPPRMTDDPQATVDSYSMQQLIAWGWSRPVSVDYYYLLEEFGLLAHSDSRDFLRLAHVVEIVTRTANRRDDFVKILKQSWGFLVKQRR
jgi:hypothetical protein